MLIPVILLFFQAQYWQGEAGVAKRMSPTKNAKIMGGSDIDITEAPYQVSIHGFDRFWCGGVLVSDVIVLGAARMLSFHHPSDYKIRAGSSIVDDGGKVYEVEKRVIHPLNHYYYVYNIAVLKLSTPVTFSDTVAAIPMRKQGEEVDDGENVQVTGWGLVKKDSGDDWPIMLQRAQIQTINFEKCQYLNDPFTVTHMICAGDFNVEKGFYFWDDGSPLVYKGELVGIANYFRYESNKIIPAQPYMKVSDLRSWIDETIQNITSHF